MMFKIASEKYKAEKRPINSETAINKKDSRSHTKLSKRMYSHRADSHGIGCIYSSQLQCIMVEHFIYMHCESEKGIRGTHTNKRTRHTKRICGYSSWCMRTVALLVLLLLLLLFFIVSFIIVCVDRDPVMVREHIFKYAFNKGIN